MFSDRFDRIQSILEVKGRELAEYANIDRTYISHFRNGKRIPSADGKTMEKLLSGIIACAKDREKVKEISDVISPDSDISDDELREGLRKWLMEEAEIKEKDRSRKRILLHNFGDRLDRSLKMTGLSNASLSRIINVDASLISRYRSGERMPKINSEIMEKTGNTLWSRIIKKEKLDELAEYMSVDLADLDEEAFCHWLFESESDKGVAGRLIETFDSFSMPSTGKLPSLSELCGADDTNCEKSFYQGIPGFRSAVLRFLGDVIKAGATEILLYSNQDMAWMVSEPDFYKKWGMLMFMCVSAGTKVRIIHNIDRGMDEMIAAIKSWLPLYMSGMIEPFYNSKSNDSIFAHTIFLCPGLACVESSHVKGTDSTAIYNYHVDNKILKVYENEMKLLFDDASPLMSVEEPDGLPEASESITIVKRGSEVSITPEIMKYGRIRMFIDISGDDKDDESGYPENLADLKNKKEDIEIYVLDEAQINNISIMMTKRFVRITYEDRPKLSFYLMHPLMKKAFASYANNLKKYSRPLL